MVLLRAVAGCALALSTWSGGRWWWTRSGRWSCGAAAPPLQLLKPPSVGSGQGTLGAQASPPAPSPSAAYAQQVPASTTWPHDAELQKPPDPDVAAAAGFQVMAPLLAEAGAAEQGFRPTHQATLGATHCCRRKKTPGAWLPHFSTLPLREGRDRQKWPGSQGFLLST